MNRFRVLANVVLLCCLLLLIACRFDPLSKYSNETPSGVPGVFSTAGFTAEEIQKVVDDVKNQKATIPISLTVPAYSFYRFDYSNAAGGHRGSTILSYDQAVASPPYGLETTARVLIYEAMKAKAGYSFNYFVFSDALSKTRITPVITAIAAQFSDTDFLLNSPQNIGSVTLVVTAVDELVRGLPLPEKAEFAPTPIASPAVELDLKPDFSDLPATTLATLFVNQDVQNIYASMTAVGLANYSLFKSSVPATSLPRAAIRAHDTGVNHNISYEYPVVLAPISGIGSVTLVVASITGVAPLQMTHTDVGAEQKISLLFSGDCGVAPAFKGVLQTLSLVYQYSCSYDSKASCQKAKGPNVDFRGWSTPAGSYSTTWKPVPASALLCSVVVDNQSIATFTAKKGEQITFVRALPLGRPATLSCYLLPPESSTLRSVAEEALKADLASDIRELTASETAAWNNTGTEGNEHHGEEVIPMMLKTWFRSKGGPYPGVWRVRREVAPWDNIVKFTPAVFRTYAAPATPTIVLDMGEYSDKPLFAFSLPLVAKAPASGPTVVGIASGTFAENQTFTVSGGTPGSTLYYSLDGGATSATYTAAVTVSENTNPYHIVVWETDVAGNVSPRSATITVTIDKTGPAAPTILGIASGTYSQNQTFTLSGAEADGALYYSLDGGANRVLYSTAVTISERSTPYQIVAWQNDAVGNVGARSATITVTILSPLPAPVVSGVQPATGITGTVLDSVQITGTDFAQGAVARLSRSGQASVTGTNLTVSSSTTLNCRFNLTNLAAGAWNIEVTNPDGKTATGTNLFTVQPGLGVTAMSPASGKINQVLSGVQITGTNFLTGAVPRLVRAGSTPVVGTGVTVNSSTQVTCSFDLTNLPVGAWDLEVTNTDGKTATGTGLFTVTPLHTVTAVSPATGKNNQVLSGVQITGTNFATGAVPRLVRAGSTPVVGTGVTVNSSTQVTCSFDLNTLAVGTWDLEVADADGKTATGTGLFAVTSASWQKSFGGSANESGMSCVSAGDGGFILAGTTSSNNGHISGSKGGEDVWIAKIDANGNLLWSKCIGGTGSDRCSGIIAHPSGLSAGFVFAGDTTSTDGDLTGIPLKTMANSDGSNVNNTRTGNTRHAWICWIDPNGAIQFQRLFGLTYDSSTPTYTSDARGGLVTVGGEFIFAGMAQLSSYEQAWCCRIDSGFNPVWKRNFGLGSGMAYAQGVALKSDNTQVLLCGKTDYVDNDFSGMGTTGSTGIGGQWNEGFVIALSATNGSVVTGKCFGGAGFDACNSIVPMSDGSLYVVGSTEGGGTFPATNGGKDVMALKLDAGLNVIWAKCFGGTNEDLGVQGLLAADGSLLFGGQTVSTNGHVTGNHGGRDLWTGNIDAGGNLLSQKCFGGTLDDFGTGFLNPSNGGFLLTGYGLSTDGDLTGTGHQTGNDDFIVLREGP